MNKPSRLLAVVCAALVALAFAPLMAGADSAIVVASTTSTQDSGLYDFLLPIFTRKTGIIVKVVSQDVRGCEDSGQRAAPPIILVVSCSDHT